VDRPPLQGSHAEMRSIDPRPPRPRLDVVSVV